MKQTFDTVNMVVCFPLPRFFDKDTAAKSSVGGAVVRLERCEGEPEPWKVGLVKPIREPAGYKLQNTDLWEAVPTPDENFFRRKSIAACWAALSIPGVLVYI